MENENFYGVINSNNTVTENGDCGYYKKLLDMYVDIFFKIPYYSKHLDELKKLPFGKAEFDLPFAMMIRDPRFGQGNREVGKTLLAMCNAPIENIVKCGRVDDLFDIFENDETMFSAVCDYIRAEIENGNSLVKKWCPRFPSKNRKGFVNTYKTPIEARIDKYYRKADGTKFRGAKKDCYSPYQLKRLELCKKIAAKWGMNKQQYQKFIKNDDTVESKLSQHREDSIVFEHVPSLASAKYSKAFARKAETKERYSEYVTAVKSGKTKMNVTTLQPYDIIKNAASAEWDADLFFNELFEKKKFAVDCLCVTDTSASMRNDDAIRQSIAMAHFLSLCSTYQNGKVITFSDYPTLIDFVNDDAIKILKNETDLSWWSTENSSNFDLGLVSDTTEYGQQINRICTKGNWMCSTDLAKVMNAVRMIDKNRLPKYLVVLSDMEFNDGSKTSIDTLMKNFHSNGITTRIVWWNFNARNETCPQLDNEGNIFISGNAPTALSFLDQSFSASEYVRELVEKYKKNVGV